MEFHTISINSLLHHPLFRSLYHIYKEINLLHICLPVTLTHLFVRESKQKSAVTGHSYPGSHNVCKCMRLLLRIILPFFIIEGTKPHKAVHAEKSWGKRILDSKVFPYLHFISTHIFFYDGRKKEQLILLRIITPASSCVDSGRQEGAFLKVISLDC